MRLDRIGSRIGVYVNRLEEGFIAALLAGMTLVAFSQVVAREFGSGWVPALELTRFLFAWLILFGMAYGIRTSLHIGVDSLVGLLPAPGRRVAGLLAAAACCLYAVILLEADWLNDWFGIETRGGAIDYIRLMLRLGIETEDLKIPRWLAYGMLPVGLGLLVLRSVQAGFLIWTGKRETVCAVHHER